MEDNKKIIIVDDEEDIRNSFSRVLRAEGYDVLTYPSCQHLLVDIVSAPPDLIILDLILPWESGENFLGKIKKIKKLSDIPVLIISGKVMKESGIQRLLDMGAGAFLKKPIEMDQLIDKTRELINSSSVGLDRELPGAEKCKENEENIQE